MADSVVAILGVGVVDPTTAVVRADDLGFSRGDGCFETCRVVTDPSGHSEVHNLDAHLARLTRSLRTLEIPADIGDCHDVIDQAVQAWTSPGEASVRLVVTRGVEGLGAPTVLATVHPISEQSVRQRREGIRVLTLPRGTSSGMYNDDAGWLLGGVKTISYAVNMAAQREAARRGTDDVIWFSTEGVVLEAPTATVVWAVGAALRTTPTGQTGILGGTTLGGLFEAARAAGFDTGAADLHVDHLADVDALWLASSVRGLVEVTEVDGSGRPTRPDLTRRLQQLAGF